MDQAAASSELLAAQVLHFVPAMRRALLQHKPDPGADHSLPDEAALLERMLSGELESCLKSTKARCASLYSGLARSLHDCMTCKLVAGVPLLACQGQDNIR